ncbi:hypothetical protein CRG98_023996 [Punica granatum]|uniref:Uncharacterized protein n=1 Tax=Punica granatum TaxID=22663 RepID=A0A2I0JHW7_PUNGR|nr:hypothetical protein CRG98_023996 [Punica granatum]
MELPQLLLLSEPEVSRGEEGLKVFRRRLQERELGWPDSHRRVIKEEGRKLGVVVVTEMGHQK